MSDTDVIITRRAKIVEIARLAGVGTSTVDRVLNDRPHVSAATRQRVEQAKTAIELGAQPVARSRPWRLKVLLPDEAGPSTEYLAACFQDVGSKGNATIECVFTKKMEPAVLSRRLRACAGQGIDAVAFQALEDPRVSDAVEDLAAIGIPCLALLSRLHSSSLVGFVGIYNVGGGNEGAVRALRDAGTAGKIILIGHNLTPKTQGYLLDGAMDVVLHQNMRRAAGQAVDALIAHLEHRDFQPGILPIEIITCENLQGATFG